MAEASRLHTIYQLLDLTADHGGRPVPIALGDNNQPQVPLDADALLSRVHCNMESLRTRLEWLRLRHAASAPRHLAERLEIQRFRIAQAMRLIVPFLREPREMHLERDAAPMGEPAERES